MQFDRAELMLLSRTGRVPVPIRSGSRPVPESELLGSRPFGRQGRAWWAIALRARAVQRSHAALLPRAGLRAAWSDPEPGRRDEWRRR